jgi:excinuclease ABC subunit B
MSQTLLRPSPPVLFIPEKQPAKPLTRRFKVVSEYEPSGDQPTAIAELVRGVQAEERDQVLLGVTGSGKTFTMAKVIEAVQRPTLILAPNKTLAATFVGYLRTLSAERTLSPAH